MQIWFYEGSKKLEIFSIGTEKDRTIDKFIYFYYATFSKSKKFNCFCYHNRVFQLVYSGNGSTYYQIQFKIIRKTSYVKDILNMSSFCTVSFQLKHHSVYEQQ